MTAALVTGGSGYFGSVLVDALLARGDRVRVLDLNPPTDPGRVEFVAADVRDAGAVGDACRGIDVVYHNVAQVPLARDPVLLRSVNVDGTVNVLAAARRAGVGKVVHTSSSAVFGIPAANPVLPTTVPAPREAYGHAKLAAEWACLRAVAEGQDVTIVRPRTVMGHGRLGIFGILFDWIADAADVIVLGHGANRYQFVHADDLADLCIRAGDHAGPAVFNGGTDRFGTMRETLQSVCDHAATGARVRSLPAGPATLAMRAASALRVAPFAPYHWIMYGRSMWFDIDHARDALGWAPRFSNAEMFAESYDWFVRHRAGAAGSDAGSGAAGSVHQRSARQGVLRLAKRFTRLLPLAR